MPVLYLLCGLPGTGKSTWARAAELCHVARLSVDDVMFERNIVRTSVDVHGGDDFRAARHRVEGELLELAGARLRAGHDVVYDEGLWTRGRRDAARGVAERCHANALLLHFIAGPEVQWRRIEARNRDEQRRQSVLTRDRLEISTAWFESLDDEDHVVVDTTEGMPDGSDDWAKK